MKTMLLACFALALVYSPASAQDLDDSLIGYWPFEGNANDGSINDNHGTVYGATLTADRFGTEGRAYSFDGNDKIVIADSDSLDRTGALSFSFWIRPETLSGTRMVFGKSN